MMRVTLINPQYRHNISYQLMQFSSEVKVKPTMLPAQQPSNFGPASCFGEQEKMWERQQGPSKLVVLREAEWSLSLTQPGVHSTQGHSRSFCSQNLTLPHPELTAGVTCCHPSPLGTEHARTEAECAVPVTATSSQFLTGVSEEFILYNNPLSWAEQLRTLETLKGNCFTFQCLRSSTEPIPSPAPQ